MDGTTRIPFFSPITGAMLLMQQKEKNSPEILATTDNSSMVFGYSPKQLFDLKSLTEVLDEASVQDFLDSVDAIADDKFHQNAGRPIIFPLSFIDSLSSHKKPFWCAVHKGSTPQNFLIVELEKDRRNGNFDPRRWRSSRFAQKSDTSNALGTQTELHSFSKVRTREFTGDEEAMQVSSVLSQFQEHLSRPGDLEQLMTTAVWLLKGMLDVEEVSVIRFDRNWNGSIMAKLGNRHSGLSDSNWLTETSLPHLQRKIFESKRVNFQKSKHPLESSLLLRNRENLSAVSNLNMSNCLLKATPLFDQTQADAIGIKYALVISIMACGDLWGVVSCLNFECEEMDVSFLDREFCHQFAELLTRNVERLECS